MNSYIWEAFFTCTSSFSKYNRTKFKNESFLNYSRIILVCLGIYLVRNKSKVSADCLACRFLNLFDQRPTTSEEGRLSLLYTFLWCIYSNRVIELFLINSNLILQPQLQITTSTKRPMFGGNIILHVRSNFVLEDFHCVVTTSKVRW